MGAFWRAARSVGGSSAGPPGARPALAGAVAVTPAWFDLLEGTRNYSDVIPDPPQTDRRPEQRAAGAVNTMGSTSTIEPDTTDWTLAAPALRWEPCLGASILDDHGLCAGCGWPAGDHDDLGDGDRGELAVVIRVPERPALRRAS